MSDTAYSRISSFQVLDQIRKDDSINVWVFNGTALSTRKKDKTKKPQSTIQPSEIFFTVQTGNQNPATLRVPKTWVPINIGLQVPKNHLFQDANFLNSVTRGILIPITNDKANEFFEKNPEAIEEYDVAISSLRRGIQELVKSDMIDFSALSDIGDEAPDGITLSVLNVVARYTAEKDGIDANEAYNLIRSLANDLTAKDKEYIVNQIDDNRIQAFVNGLD